MLVRSLQIKTTAKTLSKFVIQSLPDTEKLKKSCSQNACIRVYLEIASLLGWRANKSRLSCHLAPKLARDAAPTPRNYSHSEVLASAAFLLPLSECPICSFAFDWPWNLCAGRREAPYNKKVAQTPCLSPIRTPRFPPPSSERVSSFGRPPTSHLTADIQMGQVSLTPTVTN